MHINGYIIKEQIHKGTHSNVFRAVREKDNTPVVIKTIASKYPSQKEIDKFRNQYDIVAGSKIEGVINFYGLLQHKNSYAIIMEDIGGTDLRKTLQNKKTDLKTFLKLGIKLAAALQEIHAHHIIHKDIKPDNVIVTLRNYSGTALPASENDNRQSVISADFSEIRIIDFSISTKLSIERQSIVSENELEGSFAYISPEQTGRMNRPVDYRSDFYSLGIMFYELLTGDVPFKADDALGMVHQHIAGVPLFPHVPQETGNDIFPAVSHIIMKLIAKNAEDRYRSALGLKKDLEYCLEQYTKTGIIKQFALGEYDYSAKFKISGKLYGREQQRDVLFTIFEQVAEGSTQMLLVSGHSGIGKSALIHEIYKPGVKHRGFFISGKYDRLKKNIPYSAIIQSYNELMRYLLTKSDSELAMWKAKIVAAVGNNGQVIIDLIPAVELVIGPQPQVISLGPVETENRFKICFQRFTGVFTRKEHPLIMFLDDLQWVDLASLNLIKTLITDKETESFLLLGSYRDNEVNNAHPLLRMLDEIEKEQVIISTLSLQPLTEPEVNSLLSDSLECGREKTKGLAELVFQKTEGNPFFIDEFLKTLYARKLLTFHYAREYSQAEPAAPSNSRTNIQRDKRSMGWVWDFEKIKALPVTDNVVTLLARKITELSEETKEIVKTASCIGNRFTLETLVTIRKKSRDEIKALLSLVMEEGLFFFQDDTYFFSHDRVQEAAYSLIPGHIKKELHYKIGSMELKKCREKESETEPDKELEKKIFYIVDQLNAGTGLITGEKERYELVSLNLTAGKKAKESTAYKTAADYFSTGMNLISEKAWQDQYELSLALFIEAAETAYLNINFEQMEKLAAIVLKKAANILDMVKIYEIKIIAFSGQNRYKEAIDAGRRILYQLGVRLPENPGILRGLFYLFKTKQRLRGKRFKTLHKMDKMADKHKLAAMGILMSLLTSAYYGKRNMVPLIIAKMIKLTLKYGISPISFFAYVNYGLMLCAGMNDVKRGYALGELALHIDDDFNARKLSVRVRSIFAILIKPWRAHLNESIAPLLEGFQQALEMGDLEYASQGILGYFNLLLFSGKQIEFISREANKHIAFVEKYKQEKAFNSIKRISQFAANLAGKSSIRHRLKGDIFDEDTMLPLNRAAGSNSDICAVYTLDLMLCYLFGNYNEAAGYAVKGKKYMQSVSGIIQTPVHNFYHSLALASLYPDQDRKRQKQFLKQINRNQKKMRKWAFFSPLNYRHKYFLVEAEKARILQQHWKALGLYDKAIKYAHKNEYIQDEALAYECAAKFYLSEKKMPLAAIYIKESRHCYTEWGALEKVKQLEKEYYELLINKADSVKSQDSRDPTMDTSEMTSATVLDLNTILKASRALSGEIKLAKLLKEMMRIVIENAAASRGILILEHGGSYFIEACTKLGQKDIEVMQSIPIFEYKDFSLKTVNYVLRTKESFITGDAFKDEHCAEDNYVKEHKIKSLLCFPIIHHTKLKALFYLENNLTVNVFTPNRLEILSSLSSQIAISLENARLYENLKETERLKREMEIAERIQSAIVPDAPEHPELEIAVSMTPAEEVGGDYYDVLYDRIGNLWLAIGDVTGHGVTSGLIMMMAQSAFSAILHEHDTISPKEAAISVNRFLYNNIQDRLQERHFMTMSFLKYMGNGNFLHAGAHVPIIIYRKESGTCELIETGGAFLAMLPDISHAVDNFEFSLNKGDLMLLYTDGIIEARHKENRAILDLERLQDMVIKHAAKNVENFRDNILQETLEWCGHKMSDDIAMIVVRRKEC